MWDAVSGGLEPQSWHHSVIWALPYPNFQKFGPHLHKYNSVRVHPYAHPQHMKVLKHFIHIQYGCGMQSLRAYSLNNDTTTSFGIHLTSIFQNLAPTLLKLWGILTEARPPYPVFPITESQIFPATLSGTWKSLTLKKSPDAEKARRWKNRPLHSTSQSGVEWKYEFIQCMNAHVWIHTSVLIVHSTPLHRVEWNQSMNSYNVWIHTSVFRRNGHFKQIQIFPFPSEQKSHETIPANYCYRKVSLILNLVYRSS